MSKRFVDLALLGPLCLVLLIWQLSVPALAQAQTQSDLGTKNILVLHAFEANMPINVMTDQGLRAALESGGLGVKNQFFEYLDLARNPGPEHRKHLAELMRLRYGQRKINLIITLYAEPLQFILHEGRTLFPKAPILALYLPPGLIADGNGYRGGSGKVYQPSIATRVIQTLDHFSGGIFCGKDRIGSEKIGFPSLRETKLNRPHTIGEFHDVTHSFLMRFRRISSSFPWELMNH